MPWKQLLFGLLLAVLALGVWLLTSVLELGPTNALVAVVGGVILGLTRDRSPLARYGAFLIGLVLGLFVLVFGMAGWIGWLVGIIILTVISALTKGRLPLWAMILGGGTLAAIYTPALMANPWFLLTEYPTAFFVALAASSGGFLVTILVELLEDKEEKREEVRAENRAENDATPPPVPVSATAVTPAAAGNAPDAGSTGAQQ